MTHCSRALGGGGLVGALELWWLCRMVSISPLKFGRAPNSPSYLIFWKVKTGSRDYFCHLSFEGTNVQSQLLLEAGKRHVEINTEKLQLCSSPSPEDTGPVKGAPLPEQHMRGCRGSRCEQHSETTYVSISRGWRNKIGPTLVLERCTAAIGERFRAGALKLKASAACYTKDFELLL